MDSVSILPRNSDKFAKKVKKVLTAPFKSDKFSDVLSKNNTSESQIILQFKISFSLGNELYFIFR